LVTVLSLVVATMERNRTVELRDGEDSAMEERPKMA